MPRAWAVVVAGGAGARFGRPKQFALLGGRPFVAPDDLRAMATSVLAHRIVMTAEAEGEPKARERVVEEALAKVSYRRGMRAV